MRNKHLNIIKDALNDVYHYSPSAYGAKDTWAEFNRFSGLISGLMLADGISYKEYSRLYQLGENAFLNARGKAND